MTQGPETDALVRALAAYLLRSPGASDTAEGIRRWWLADRQEVSVDGLLGALNWMKERHLIEDHIAADGRVRFRRSGASADLERLIAGAPPPSP